MLTWKLFKQQRKAKMVMKVPCENQNTILKKSETAKKHRREENKCFSYKWDAVPLIVLSILKTIKTFTQF